MDVVGRGMAQLVHLEVLDACDLETLLEAAVGSRFVAGLAGYQRYLTAQLSELIERIRDDRLRLDRICGYFFALRRSATVRWTALPRPVNDLARRGLGRRETGKKKGSA